MNINEILELAKIKSRNTKNVIARGIIIEFLLFDKDSNKLFINEVSDLFDFKRQNIYHILKTFDNNYQCFSFYQKCKKLVNENKDTVREHYIK